MTDAEKSKKFLNYAGLEHFIDLLVNMGVKGNKGLISQDDLTQIQTKLNQVATSENLTALQNKVAALEALIESDSDGAINKFNEIVAFLAGITDDATLNGKLADIATQIADAKKAGTDAQAALADKVDKVAGKGLSTNDYTTAEKNAVATIGNKVDKVAGKGLSTNDYTTAEKTAVATIANKANSADVYSKTDADATFVKAADMVAITDAEIDALVTE